MTDYERGLNVAAALGPVEPPEQLPDRTEKGYYVIEENSEIRVVGVGGPQIYERRSLPFASVIFGPYGQRRLAWDALCDNGSILALGYPLAVVFDNRQARAPKPEPLLEWIASEKRQKEEVEAILNTSVLAASKWGENLPAW